MNLMTFFSCEECHVLTDCPWFIKRENRDELRGVNRDRFDILCDDGDYAYLCRNCNKVVKMNEINVRTD